MFAKPIDPTEATQNPHELIEKALVEEYLHEHGYSLAGLKNLPAEMAEHLLKEARRYVMLKLEERKAQANLMQVLRKK